jgi:hypothetical protein
MEEQHKLFWHVDNINSSLSSEFSCAAIFPKSRNIPNESTSRLRQHNNYIYMKPKEIISSVGYEKGTFQLVWPVNLQPSNRSLSLPKTKIY